MTVGEMKRVLDGIPNNMYVFMFVDEINCLEVCATSSNIEEVKSDMDQYIRVFMIRPAESEGLLIPMEIVKNLQ